MKNRNTMFTAVLFMLTCFALLPKVQALVPPPDGGYFGQNTAEGTGALSSVQLFGRGVATNNTALGFDALTNDTTGSANTAVGSDALFDNIGGRFNTATGVQALFHNVGDNDGNTADGYQALHDNYYGVQNTAVGFQAVYTGGIENTAIGFQALHGNTPFAGLGNTAVGFQALYNNTGSLSPEGQYNTATGDGALFANLSGSSNTAAGAGALYLNDTGDNNTAMGFEALHANLGGTHNTASGRHALYNNASGDLNTAIGVDALLNNGSGSGNVAVGDGAGFNVTTADDVICVGSGGDNISGTCYIGNIFGQISAGGAPVLINSGDRLGTSTSSRRFKEEIKPMDRVSEALFSLKPVAFRYKKEIDPAGKSQLGLVAEDVEKVNPDLIVRDKEGKPYSVRYDQVDGVLPGGNNADGFGVLTGRAIGGFNTGNGWFSLHANAVGSANTAVGAATLFANTADNNTATGAGALFSNTTGYQNTATGAFALFSNTTGFSNTAIGSGALFRNTTGDTNTANGRGALESNTTGRSNTADGEAALAFNTIGDFNTADGNSALANNTTGSSNIGLGLGAGSGVTTASNVICIGLDGQNVSNSCYIGQIFGATSSGGIAVFINSNGRLGTATSSRRFKEDIKPMDKASEALLALNPVTFRYNNKIDPRGISQFGLVAEDVEKVNPDLVVRDKEGKPYSVRYDAVNAMLLNEFLKEHRKNEEQEATIAQLKNDFQTVSTLQRKEIQLLSTQLREQAEQIQKVSAQLELSKIAPQTVLNNQ